MPRNRTKENAISHNAAIIASYIDKKSAYRTEVSELIAKTMSYPVKYRGLKINQFLEGFPISERVAIRNRALGMLSEFELIETIANDSQIKSQAQHTSWKHYQKSVVRDRAVQNNALIIKEKIGEDVAGSRSKVATALAELMQYPFKDREKHLARLLPKSRSANIEAKKWIEALLDNHQAMYALLDDTKLDRHVIGQSWYQQYGTLHIQQVNHANAGVIIDVVNDHSQLLRSIGGNIPFSAALTMAQMFSHDKAYKDDYLKNHTTTSINIINALLADKRFMRHLFAELNTTYLKPSWLPEVHGGVANAQLAPAAFVQLGAAEENGEAILAKKSREQQAAMVRY